MRLQPAVPLLPDRPQVGGVPHKNQRDQPMFDFTQRTMSAAPMAPG